MTNDECTPKWLLGEDPLFVNKCLLRSCGLLPANTSKEKRLKIITSTVLLYFSITMLAGAFVQAYLSHRNFMEIIECATVCITQVKCFFKLLIILYYEKDIRFIIESLINNFSVHENMLKDEVLSKIRIGKRVAWWISMSYTSLFVFSVGVLTLEGILAAISHESNFSSEGNAMNITDIVRPLPLKVWLPFENKSPWYEIAFTYIIFGFNAEIYSICVVDTFMLVLVMYVTIQFELLGNSITFATENVTALLDNKGIGIDSTKRGTTFKAENVKIIKPENSNLRLGVMMTVSGSSVHELNNVQTFLEEEPIQKSETYRQEMDAYLGRCIARHQAILNYVDRLNIVSSPIQFLQALTSSLLICTLGFTAIASGNTAILPKITMYVFDTLLQIGLPCWFATQLQVQGERIAEVSYDCKWYDEPASYQRSIGLIMRRAQRPVILTLGPFGTLSLELFAGVVQSAYSYLTLLRQVYE